MSTTPALRVSLPAHVEGACDRHLRDLLEEVAGVTSVGIVAPDGFEVAAIVAPSINVSKVAAVTSTISAVAQVLSDEAGLGDCGSVVIDSSHGKVVLCAVPANEARYCLAAVCEERALLGRVLYAVKEKAARIGAELSRA